MDKITEVSRLHSQIINSVGEAHEESASNKTTVRSGGANPKAIRYCYACNKANHVAAECRSKASLTCMDCNAPQHKNKYSGLCPLNQTGRTIPPNKSNRGTGEYQGRGSPGGQAERGGQPPNQYNRANTTETSEPTSQTISTYEQDIQRAVDAVLSRREKEAARLMYPDTFETSFSGKTAVLDSFTKFAPLGTIIEESEQDIFNDSCDHIWPLDEI